MQKQDLTIIGGGVMGLFTAFYASQFASKITILERSYVGDKKTASFSYTRSIRNDYLDPLYAGLAYEARNLWLDFQATTPEACLIDCGCLNLAKKNVTPSLEETYAVQSGKTLRNLHLKNTEFTHETLQQRFPQFDVDLGWLDEEAGMLYVPAVTSALRAALHAKGVQIIEHTEVQRIEPDPSGISISTSSGSFETHKLVLTAGHGTNDLLQQVSGCSLQFPLQPDRPSQCKYFIPPAHKRERFTTASLPVFAYLDVGVYGHPIYEGKTPGVKIGFYNPPDIQKHHTHIQGVHSFVAECMPDLLDAEAVDVEDVDQCFYDLVADDNFILGNIPGYSDIYVGVGWRGTGYKYAPWAGKTLMQLALRQGTTVYDISRFTPQRFA